mmetsp:Transcript_8985/g.29954  ORF Transcript_8985/g.29954 Transcript_8985/m.29954 type:complete len:114 (-) Transcript_8985:473-814(-)
MFASHNNSLPSLSSYSLAHLQGEYKGPTPAFHSQNTMLASVERFLTAQRDSCREAVCNEIVRSNTSAAQSDFTCNSGGMKLKLMYCAIGQIFQFKTCAAQNVFFKLSNTPFQL